MALEKTLMCGDLIKGRDDKCGIFCKKTVSSVKIMLATTSEHASHYMRRIPS